MVEKQPTRARQVDWRQCQRAAVFCWSWRRRNALWARVQPGSASTQPLANLDISSLPEALLRETVAHVFAAGWHQACLR